MPKTRNIIIFLALAVVLILVYIFFVKQPFAPATALVSSIPNISGQNQVNTDSNGAVAKDFLILLLSVKDIKLNDTIFGDDAFVSLRDSSITLTPDGSEGRPNPFAPLGA